MTDQITGDGHKFEGDTCSLCSMTGQEAAQWPDVTCERAWLGGLHELGGDDREWLLERLDNDSNREPPTLSNAESVEAILASVRRDFATEDERLAFMAKTILDLGAAAGQQRVLWDQERDALRAEAMEAVTEIARLRRGLALRDASPLALSNDLFAAHLIQAAARAEESRLDSAPSGAAGAFADWAADQAKDREYASIGLAFRITPAMRQVGADALAGYDEAIGDRGTWAERVYQAMARTAVGALLGLIPGKASAALLSGPARD